MRITIPRSQRYLQGRALTALACVAFLLTASCGGDEQTSKDDSGTVTVRPGQRLVWDQAANSLQQLKSLTFKLFVDDADAKLTAPACVEAQGPIYQCSGGLPRMSPGRHVLELTALLDGKESSRSSPLVVMMTSSSESSSRTVPFDGEAVSLRGSRVCTASGSECFDVRTIAMMVGHVSALSPSSDGRLFFVENGRSVRVIDGSVLLPDAAFTLADTSARIVGMAVDSAFDSTHSIFIAWTRREPGGAPTLALTRYRELQNTLAQGATLVTGLPFEDDQVGPLAVDGAGLVYLALPAAHGEQLGMIMRFARDGSVAHENPRWSPIVSEGYARPADIAVDAGGRVWLTGTSARSPETVATFTMAKTESLWPIRPTAVQELSQKAQHADTVTLRSPEAARATTVTVAESGVFITVAGELFHGSARSISEPPELEKVHFASRVTEAVKSPRGTGYAAAVMGAGTAILELRSSGPSGTR